VTSSAAATSKVRLVHPGHHEFLDVQGVLYQFRSEAFDPVDASTDVSSNYSFPDSGNLRSINKGTFGGQCQSLTIPDNNNLLLPVSPFTTWLIECAIVRI